MPTDHIHPDAQAAIDAVLTANPGILQPRNPNRPEPTFRTYLDAQEHDQLDARAATAEQERDDALDERNQARAAAQTLEVERDDLRIQVTALKTELARHVRALQDATRHIDGLEADLRSQTRAVREALAERDQARAALEQAQRQALTQASDLLWAWAEEMGDVGGTGPRAARKRTIKACARKIAPEPTDDEMRDALAELLSGMANRAKADAAAGLGSSRRAQGAEHDWLPDTEAIPWPHCGTCGIVQRRDGQHGPCRGPAPVELRAQEPPVDARRRHALAFNAITRTLADIGPFVALSVRERCAEAVLAALDGDDGRGRCPSCGATYPRTIPAGEDQRCWTCATADQTGVDEPAPVSSVIAASSKFARAAGHPGGPDWVRLRTGSGRQYEGHRAAACPGDGVAGHQHDIRCIEREG